MTIVKKICDCCHKEANWLFEKPVIVVAGYNVSMRNNGETEFCRNCIEDAARIFNEYGEVANHENERSGAEKR